MFRYFLIFLVVYLAFKLIQSFAKPKRKSQYYTSYKNTGYRNNQQRKEGETTIQKTKENKEKKIQKNEGDYIDYEEV